MPNVKFPYIRLPWRKNGFVLWVFDCSIGYKLISYKRYVDKTFSITWFPKREIYCLHSNALSGWRLLLKGDPFLVGAFCFIGGDTANNQSKKPFRDSGGVVVRTSAYIYKIQKILPVLMGKLRVQVHQKTFANSGGIIRILV